MHIPVVVQFDLHVLNAIEIGVNLTDDTEEKTRSQTEETGQKEKPRGC